MNEVVKTDVVLIGAGPIGLEIAVALKHAGIDYIHLEARQLGHTISWFPRQAHFFSSPERIAICGVPLITVDQSKATREEYLAYLLGIVQQFGLSIRSYERVTRLSVQENGRFFLETERAAGSRSYSAAKVIVAIGDMHGPRPLTHDGVATVPGCDLSHVSSYFVEPHPFSGQDLMIVGGKNSAVEAAIRCYRAGARVTLCHRQPELASSVKYWLKPEIEWLIKAGHVRQLSSRVPVEITPTTVRVAPVDLNLRPDSDRDHRESIPADFVLLLIGYEMDPSLLKQAGVELYGPGRTPRFNPQTMQTNTPGLYVAGTAAAGTQLGFKLFIENCHAHVVRILRDLTGQDPVHLNPLGFSLLDYHPMPAES